MSEQAFQTLPPEAGALLWPERLYSRRDVLAKPLSCAQTRGRLCLVLSAGSTRSSHDWVPHVQN
jgi:hypothetical protein